MANNVPPVRQQRFTQFATVVGADRADIAATPFDDLDDAQTQMRLLAPADRATIVTVKQSIGNILSTCAQRRDPKIPFLAEWDDHNNIKAYYKRFHQTPVGWDKSPSPFTYMDMLLFAYAYIRYLCTEIKQRDLYSSTTTTQAAGGWTQLKEGFILEFSAYLPYILFSGPHTPASESKNTFVKTLDKANDPVYPFFVFPIFQMMRNEFPGEFHFPRCQNLELSAFVPKHHRKMNDYGVYSIHFMDEQCRQHGDLKNEVFHKGMFYPIFRVLSMISFRFSPLMKQKRATHGKRKLRQMQEAGPKLIYNCSPQERADCKAQAPLEYRVTDLLPNVQGQPAPVITILTNKLWSAKDDDDDGTQYLSPPDDVAVM